MPTEETKIIISAKDEATKVFNNVKNTAMSLKPVLAGLGMAGFTLAGAFSAIGSAVKSTADRLDKLDEMSTKTGVSVEMLTSLELAAKQNGISMNNLAIAIRNMYRTMDEANRGSKETSRIYKALGIDIKDSSGKLKSGSDAFIEIADAIAKIDNPAQRSAMAMKVFGRAGTELLPMLEGGEKALKEYIDEARRLGLIFTNDDAKRAAAYADVMDTFNARVTALKNKLAMEVIPTLTAMMELLATGKVSKQTEKNWAEENIEKLGKLIKEREEQVKNLQTNITGKIGLNDARIKKENEEIRRLYMDQYNWRKKLQDLEKEIPKKSLVFDDTNKKDTGKTTKFKSEFKDDTTGAYLASQRKYLDALAELRKDSNKVLEDYYKEKDKIDTKWIEDELDKQDKMKKAQQEAYDVLYEQAERHQERMEQIKQAQYEMGADILMATSEAMGQALIEGKDVLKAGSKEFMTEVINMLQRELLAAEISTALRALLEGPFAWSELANVGALMTANMALAALKAEIGNAQSGEYVNNAGVYMLHKNERVLSDTDNRALITMLDRIDKRLGEGAYSGGAQTININAIDTQSFQQFMRRGGNAVIQYELQSGRLRV